MKIITAPTTNTRKRIHGAAQKAGWVEDLSERRDGDNLDRFEKGDKTVAVGYHASGRLASASLLHQAGPRTSKELGFTSRFQQIILWLGSVR